MGAELNFNYLKEVYFAFGKNVPYFLKCGVELQIRPVLLENSLIFNMSYGILDIDKNASNNPDIISMPYLKFLLLEKMSDSYCKQQLFNICKLCLDFNNPYLKLDKNNRAVLYEIGEEGVILSITQKEFEDIKRIILYQNLPDYNDDYINPDLKKAMQEQDELKIKNIELPSLERKINIITSHTGISLKEQLGMTMRNHMLLFKEVVGEVNFQALKAISFYAGRSNEVQWIYPQKRGKFDEYVTSVEEYNKSFGGDGKIVSSPNEEIQNMINKFENY